ncbi:MAG: rhomboid family intramembrane serine protease [Muribaculaceae bacterium]|nr:rhomboid family intramembrane serine protease [Muribaculaceae bacterium]
MNYALIKRYFGGSQTLAWLTLGLPLVWIVVTLLSLSGRMMHFNMPIAEWLTLPSSFAIFLTRPWTLITYMAVHFDVLHMLFNVLWLYWFGRILINTLFDRHLLLAFVGGGLAGGILFLLSAAAGFGSGWLCGCSAAVIAVMCVAAIRLPDHQINLFLIGEVKLKWVAVICCLLTFFGGGGNQAAHIGGLLWGVALGLMLRAGNDPSLWLSRLKWHPSSNAGGNSKRNADKMVKVLKDRQNDMQRLDQLLDKIRLSGYESLSRKERKELDDLSRHLDKDKR